MRIRAVVIAGTRVRRIYDTYAWRGYAWAKGYGWRLGWYDCTSHPEMRYRSDVWVTDRAPYSAGIFYWCTKLR